MGIEETTNPRLAPGIWQPLYDRVTLSMPGPVKGVLFGEGTDKAPLSQSNMLYPWRLPIPCHFVIHGFDTRLSLLSCSCKKQPCKHEAFVKNELPTRIGFRLQIGTLQYEHGTLDACPWALDRIPREIPSLVNFFVEWELNTENLFEQWSDYRDKQCKVSFLFQLQGVLFRPVS